MSAQYSQIRKQLENLPIYTELLKPARSFHMKPLADGDNEFVLLSKCSPFAKIDFEIPAGTTAIVQDKPFGSTIHFRTTVNYFNVLHNEINELLAETLRYTADIDAVRERRVCAGIKYLAQAVRNVTDPLRGISSEMVHPTEMVFDILTKFKAVQQPPIELLAKCLAVCANLVPLFDEEIVRRVVNLNVLPYVTQSGGDYRQLCGGAGFESGLVGYYLINFEKNCGRYDFLLTYLEFLHVYAKVSVCMPRTMSAIINICDVHSEFDQPEQRHRTSRTSFHIARSTATHARLALREGNGSTGDLHAHLQVPVERAAGVR